MKKFNFVVTGNLNAQVKAKDEEEATQMLEDWLEDYSPVSNWEVQRDVDEKYESIDIELPEKSLIKVGVKK